MLRLLYRLATHKKPDKPDVDPAVDSTIYAIDSRSGLPVLFAAGASCFPKENFFR
jgi:hypothetical protein